MTAFALDQPLLRVPEALRRHWRAWTVLATMAVLWAVAGISVAIESASPRPELVREGAVPPAIARLRAAVPATAATQLRQIAPNNALAFNAAIPLSNTANPAARPFTLGSASAADRLRSIDCLTAAIYYEAATEPLEGQRAVAQVVLNRVRHPAYPATVCGVVFEGSRRSTGCQFSFSCDGSLRRAPMASYWERARQVAQSALSGSVYAPVGWATHYHTNWVVPYWASSLVKSANVGTHIFYRWTGGWGRGAAFGKRYAGVEPAIAWRGGFGQPLPSQVQNADARDAAAAQAAAEAAPGSVDSFHRSVLRRYEPLRRDTADAVIAARTGADRTLSTSQRWALTGNEENSTQAPLGRRTNAPEPPRELQGVRFRSSTPAPVVEAPPVARWAPTTPAAPEPTR